LFITRHQCRWPKINNIEWLNS